MERKQFKGEDGDPGKRMLVVLPQTLAASHLRQCERYLNTIGGDRIGFLYAAEAAHLALHTILVALRYGDIGLAIMLYEGKEAYPGGPKEGGQIKSFKLLFQDVHVDEVERQAIMLLTDIRDRLQHPIPGPMGYIIGDLISGIEAAVRAGMGIWNDPRFSANSDGPARDEALAASHAILVHCLMMRSQRP